MKKNELEDTLILTRELAIELYEQSGAEGKKFLDKHYSKFFKSPISIAAEEAISKIGIPENSKMLFNRPYANNKVVGFRYYYPEETFSRDYVLVELPNSNREWTFEVFDYIKKFVSVYKDSYPIHGEHAEKVVKAYIDIDPEERLDRNYLVIEFYKNIS